MAEILLNKESFEGLNTRFDAVFEEAKEGMNYSERAERVQHDAVIILGIRMAFLLKIEDIKSVMRLIVDSFTTTDKDLKAAAEKIVGVDIHEAISTGDNVVYDENGNYTVQPGNSTGSSTGNTGSPSGSTGGYNSGYSSSGNNTGGAVPIAGNVATIEGYQGLQQHLSDNCTNTSLAMMIQRYDLVHNGSCNLVYDDIGKNDFYWAVEDFGQHMDRTLPDGRTYHTHWGDTAWFSEVGGGNLQAGMARVLNEFPEGIELYGSYASGGAHAILLTGCTSHGDGTYSFTAIDPATGMETDLTETTLFRGSNGHPGSYSSVDELLNNLFYYSYIESIG